MSDAVPVSPAPISELAPGLHRIELMGGFVSAYLLDRDGELTLVDTGTPGEADAILGAIASLGHQTSRLEHVVLTHAHLDHGGSAAALRDATGARILLSKADANLIATGWSTRTPKILPGFEETLPTPPGVTPADLLRPSTISPFDVDCHVEAGPIAGLPDLEAIPAPGHCAGQMALLWHRRGGVLICGDAVTNFGEIAIAAIGEDFDLARRSARNLARLEFEIAAFGHGEPVVGGGGAAACRPGLAIGRCPPRTVIEGSAAPEDLPPRGEFLVRGAHVLSMDEAIGDLPSGDVHVRDGAIVAVGARLAAPGAEPIDGTGMICMPGFVETHWHLWTSVLRPFMRLDDPGQSYMPVTSRLGAHYQPEDSYRAVRMGLAEALDAGVTTVHNWAHNVRSPAHADAEVRAMRDTGIRGRFSYGTPANLQNNQLMDLADLARVKRELAGDRMLTLGICSRNVGSDPNPLRGNITIDMAQREWGAARELGLPITLHTSGPPVTRLLDGVGLLGPGVQFVHPLNTSAEDRTILAQRGVSYSTSGTLESRRAGDIQLSELLQAGIKTSISVDNTTTGNCDCFVCMRVLYNLNRHREGGEITTKRMVQLATIDGAVDLGIADHTGSLTPGKRADLILVRTSDVNMAAMGDPYDALVGLAHPANVHMVMVDGRLLCRDNDYTALDHGDIIAAGKESAAKLRERARWPA